MEDTLISFETAKLAKEKGFKGNKNSTIHIDWSQSYDYQTKIPFEPYCFLNGDIYNNYKYSVEKFKKLFRDKKAFSVKVDIPTQSLLAKWLREIHNIDCFPQHQFLGESGCIKYTPLITTSINDIDSEDYCNYSFEEIYNTYEQAFEFGLQEALKLIKINKK